MRGRPLGGSRRTSEACRAGWWPPRTDVPVREAATLLSRGRRQGRPACLPNELQWSLPPRHLEVVSPPRICEGAALGRPSASPKLPAAFAQGQEGPLAGARGEGGGAVCEGQQEPARGPGAGTAGAGQPGRTGAAAAPCRRCHSVWSLPTANENGSSEPSWGGGIFRGPRGPEPGPSRWAPWSRTECWRRAPGREADPLVL